MKILYDYQILAQQKYGGISRYFYELINKINCHDEVKTDIRCILSINSYFKDHPGTREYGFSSALIGTGTINRILYKYLLKHEKYDIFHPTYYNPYFLSHNKGKLVITVYDMIHEIFPDYFGDADKTAKNKKELIYAADKIIAISQSTKNDILKFYPDIPESKISVIYIGSNFEPVCQEEHDDRFPQKYILFVGTRTNYKNFRTFFEAVRPLMEKDTDLGLVCMGGGPFSAEELMQQGNLRQRVLQMNVNDKTLSYAYSNAQCFVFPSMYEGFGIPTLEAFACDCPVILSNTSSMPEVGGDAVLYIDPHNEQDIREKTAQMLCSENIRQMYIKKGREQLKKFDWNNIAEQTLKCYYQVINEE